MEDETSTEAPVGPQEELERALKRVEELQEALESRIVIEQAKGVLRERFGWDVDDAFEILRYASRSSRTKIHELAQAVVDSDDTPQAIVVALARGARWRAAGMRERAEALHARADDLDARIQAQRQRMAAWPARDGRPRDGRRPEPLPRRRAALRVVAPTYEAARMLLQRTSIVFTAEVVPSRDGHWEVNLYERSQTGDSNGSDELVHRALGIVQEWVRELDTAVEIVLAHRRFTMGPTAAGG